MMVLLANLVEHGTNIRLIEDVWVKQIGEVTCHLIGNCFLNGFLVPSADLVVEWQYSW
jgi:hypothetical protein